MNKCFMDTTRDKNNLGDYYQEMKNIPPLLICKQNKELARGGEYNNLIKTLGGKQTPAFGAAINLNQLI